jgi:hypothetical protein
MNNMTRKQRSKTVIINLKDEIHCRIPSTDEINYATTSVDESDTKTSVELFPLFQLPHLSHPLEAEFITTEEHKIVSIYGISLNSEAPCFIENFGYQEVVSSFPQDKRSLLLTNAANIDILRFLCMTMHKISVKFDQIIFIDCIDINNVELRNEIICKNPKNSVIVLYDISEHNVNLFKEIGFHLIGHDSLIIASLLNGEALPSLDENSQKSLVVVNSSRHVKDECQKKKTTKKDIEHFPTPSAAKWPDVKITFVDDNHVSIKVISATRSKVHFSKMGLEFRSTGESGKLWKTLRTFALHNGIIPPKVDEQGKLIKLVTPDDVKRLRKELCFYFCLDGNPIPYLKGKYTKGGYTKAEGYKTSFDIQDNTYLSRKDSHSSMF